MTAAFGMVLRHRTVKHLTVMLLALSHEEHLGKRVVWDMLLLEKPAAWLSDALLSRVDLLCADEFGRLLTGEWEVVGDE